jgi:LEA14-like dessication related protein
VIELTLSAPQSAAGQPFSMRLRVRNTTEAILPAHLLSLKFSLDGMAVAQFNPEVIVDVPALGSEVIPVSGQIEAALVGQLARLMRGNRSQIPYTLEGQVDAAGRILQVRYEGWLNATPGKPGSFR